MRRNILNGLIIHELTEKYFTNLREVFDVLGSIATKYNWLLSDYDCNIYPSAQISINEQYVWLAGNELVSIFEEFEIQFIWGVATAYAKETKLEDILRNPYPFANGNEAFWKPEVTMQNPLAEIEIVSWDSTFLLVIAKSKEIVEMFEKRYPNSVDLAVYNSS